MYIEFLEPSPRAGLREHVSQSTATSLITAGFACEVVLTPEEKLALRFGNYGKTPAPPPVPEWDVVRTLESRDLVVVRRCGGTTAYFDGPPDRKKWPDCPKDIEKKFAQMRKPNEPRAALPWARR